MIRYAPVRRTPSASLKEEHIFENTDAMIKHLFDRWRRILAYVGEQDPLRPDQIVIRDVSGDDPIIGWKIVRDVFVKTIHIGFCTEMEENT